MTNRAALQGSLVDIRNVGTHKSVKLTVHVPEEDALRVTEIFGWPTAVNPVPVALARITETKQFVHKEHRRWNDLSVGEQAGIRCSEKAFWQYLTDFGVLSFSPGDANEAAECLRQHFGVASRKDIPADKWRQFDDEYQLWLRSAQ